MPHLLELAVSDQLAKDHICTLRFALYTPARRICAELLAGRLQTCENQMHSRSNNHLEINKMPDSPNNSPPGDLVVVGHDLVIPVSELVFRFSRSSGPGGQHVNRSETRVELLFDVRTSPSLSDDQRQRLLLRLRTQLDKDGVLHIVSSETRSQPENRMRSLSRLQTLLASALRRRKRRIPTAPSAAARERRLSYKRAQSRLKQSRRDTGSQEYD
jgi:ribosome-associated protein